MINFLEKHKEIIIEIIVPISLALIGLLMKILNTSARSQKIGNINGNNNKVINGDVKTDSKKIKIKID